MQINNYSSINPWISGYITHHSSHNAHLFINIQRVIGVFKGILFRAHCIPGLAKPVPPPFLCSAGVLLPSPKSWEAFAVSWTT